MLSEGVHSIGEVALRPWRDLDADLFRFTATDLRELYVAVMTAFERSGVLSPTLNLDGVRSALRAAGWDEPTDDDQLVAALGSLTGWGLLEVSQDHTATYATPEDFERRNLQWSLAPKGEAAVVGMLAALDSLRHAVSLQPAVLDAIGDALVEIAALLERPADAKVDAQVHLRLAEVESHLAGLVASVRQFNTQLQRLVRSSSDDDGGATDLFLDVKRRTVSYLEEFVEGVDRPRRRVERAVRDLEDRRALLFDRAVRGANLAPVAGGDPAPAWIGERQRRWEALRSWFAPAGDEAPQVASLLRVAQAAIVELLRVLERRWDERRRSASVAGDLRALARWFRDAPSEDDAHRLFHAAFGLWPSRHAHLAAADGEARQPRRSWGEAEAVEVAPSLRTTGSVHQRGRSRPVARPDRWRAQRLRDQAEELLAHQAVREALATDGRVDLRTIGRLEPAAFRELLDLLAHALDAPVAQDRSRRATSTDGRVEVVLWPSDGRTARLHATGGTLSAPNFGISIELLGRDDALAHIGGVAATEDR